MSDPEKGQNQEVSSRVVAGASFSVISNILTHSFAVISIAVLGRLLDPKDFGIIAIALIFTGVSDALMNRQFDLALIRTKNIDASYYNTVFGMSVCWGISAGLLLFFGAETFAGWFGEPDLAPVLRVLCLLPVMDSLRNPYFIDFERKLMFLPIVGVHLMSKATQAVVGITLAWIIGDYWALVGALLGLALMRLIPTWILTKNRPRPQLVHWRYFLSFGGWLSGTGLLGFIMQKSDTALVSKFLGTTVVGLYNMGAELAMMATHHLSGQLLRMVYPGLSTVSDDPARLRNAYHKAQEMIMGFMVPLGVGVALVAPEAITVFVGEKWLDAVPVLQALAPVLALSSLTFNVQAIIMVDGQTKTMFMRNLAVAVVQVPLIILGLQYYGFAGAIAARVAATIFHTYLSLKIAARMVNANWWHALFVGWRSFAAAGVMILTVLAVGSLLGPQDGFMDVLFQGAIKVSLGGLAYAISHAIMWHIAGRPEGFEQQILKLIAKVTGRKG